MEIFGYLLVRGLLLKDQESLFFPVRTAPFLKGKQMTAKCGT